MSAARQLRLVKQRPAEPEPSDAELVERARDGDRSAQSELYRRHARAAGSLAARLLGTRADVEDILHDSFVDALTGLGRLRDPSAFRPWLLRIVVMKVRQKIRRRRIARRLGLYRSEDEATLDRLASPQATPEQRAELSLINDELCRLPVEEKVAWMLSRVEGYTLAEIAVLTDCGLTTVKRRLKRANDRMARWVRFDQEAP